ncbi:MAG TPA: hypothetical protein VGN42_13185 [Pirellulales bacterium]|jgi:hypothetical protein|nr:hypothetical protein [Pirellulales bacterium]
METSLHRELKRIYAGADARSEVRHGKYRIDVVDGDELVEIQHGSLGAIRHKVRELLQTHAVRVVKPIIANKLLVKRSRKQGPIAERRRSPKQGTLLSLFDELVYFTKVFPHPRLTLEVALVDVEEWRYPGRGRRRRYRKNAFVIEDQKLCQVHSTHRFRTAADLAALLPARLPAPFHSGQLSDALGVPRPVAQRIAYCLRETGAARLIGKQGNALLYELGAAPAAKRRRKAA